MDIIHLAGLLGNGYWGHHWALGCSPKTAGHHRDTCRSFRRYPDAAGATAAGSAPTTATMQHFAAWLRASSTRGWLTRTERSV
jgi:hypothetical protein